MPKTKRKGAKSQTKMEESVMMVEVEASSDSEEVPLKPPPSKRKARKGPSPEEEEHRSSCFDRDCSVDSTANDAESSFGGVVKKTASSVKVAAGGGATNNGNSNGAARRTPTAEPSDGARPPQTTKDKSGVSAGKEKPALLTSKCILRTITAFLASNKRNSYNAQMRAKQTNRRRRQRKMDELSGKINPKLLENLRKKTKFTKDEVDALCRIYRKLISNCQYSAKALATGSSTAAIAKPHATAEGIDRIVFRELLHSTFDIVTEEILMERIFCCWDRAHEGMPLRLEGWLTGLSIFLRGSLAERANFCFRVYDLNSDGFITKDEMFTLLRNCLIKQPQDEDPDEGVKDLVEIVLKKFDLDKDGKVSIEDFMGTIETEPLLLQAFGQCLPSETATVSFFSTLQI